MGCTDWASQEPHQCIFLINTAKWSLWKKRQIFVGFLSFFFKIKNFFNVYLFILIERERERMSRGGAERQGEKEFQAGSTLPASTEPEVGLELTDHEIMTWAKIKSRTLNQLSHPGARTIIILKAEEGYGKILRMDADPKLGIYTEISQRKTNSSPCNSC